jgi:cell division protein FtsW (lipid II flippase)
MLAKYRATMVVAAVAGVVIAIAGYPDFGTWLVFMGVALLGMTWMGFMDRWLNRAVGRGIVGGTSTLVAAEDGLHFDRPIGSGVIPWSALTAVRIGPTSIVFQRDRVMASYVPTSAFGSEAERDAFVDYARTHIASAKVHDASREISAR